MYKSLKLTQFFMCAPPSMDSKMRHTWSSPWESKGRFVHGHLSNRHFFKKSWKCWDEHTNNHKKRTGATIGSQYFEDEFSHRFHSRDTLTHLQYKKIVWYKMYYFVFHITTVNDKVYILRTNKSIAKGSFHLFAVMLDLLIVFLFFQCSMHTLFWSASKNCCFGQ